MAVSSAVAKSMNGARCILVLDGKTVGVAQSVGLSIGFQVDPIFTIGRYETAELVPNSQQPVTITMRMVRIIGNTISPLAALRVPILQDTSPNGLLLNQDFTILLIDRQNNGSPVVSGGTTGATAGASPAFAQIQKCRTTGWTFDSTASQTSEMTLTMTGIYIGDEGVNVTDNKDASEAPFDVV